jgi:hypothetical protein
MFVPSPPPLLPSWHGTSYVSGYVAAASANAGSLLCAMCSAQSSKHNVVICGRPRCVCGVSSRQGAIYYNHTSHHHSSCCFVRVSAWAATPAWAATLAWAATSARADWFACVYSRAALWYACLRLFCCCLQLQDENLSAGRVVWTACSPASVSCSTDRLAD